MGIKVAPRLMYLRCDLKALLQKLSAWLVHYPHLADVSKVWPESLVANFIGMIGALSTFDTCTPYIVWSTVFLNPQQFVSPLKWNIMHSMWIQDHQVQITWKADFNCFNCSRTSNLKHTSLDGWALNELRFFSLGSWPC
jgi:hypothetical protein